MPDSRLQLLFPGQIRLPSAGPDGGSPQPPSSCGNPFPPRKPPPPACGSPSHPGPARSLTHPFPLPNPKSEINYHQSSHPSPTAVGMPRGNATACVSMPRHRSPPIRPGENNPGPDHGFKILRPGNLPRARHASPPGKGGEANLKQSAPVAATTRIRLPTSVPEAKLPRGQKQPGKIESPYLARHHAPKLNLQKKSQKHLVSL